MKPPRPTERLKSTISSLDPAELAKAQVEIEKAVQDDSLTPPPIVSSTSIEDITKAKGVAEDFMRGMDRISTVLMTLVLKFGRAANLMWVVLICMAVGVVLFATALVTSYTLHDRMADMQASQVRMIEQLDKVTLESVHAAKRAEDAKKMAKAAEEAAPKVVIDAETGKPKLLVQSEGDVPKSTKKNKPTLSKDGKKVEFDLNF